MPISSYKGKGVKILTTKGEVLTGTFVDLSNELHKECILFQSRDNDRVTMVFFDQIEGLEFEINPLATLLDNIVMILSKQANGTISKRYYETN